MAVLRTMAAVVIAVTCTEAALQQPPRDGRPLQQTPSALLTQAHQHYKSQQWARAVEKYEAVLAAAPTHFNAWFFLANSYDNLYRPSRAGDPANDEYIHKAVQHYRTAAERDTDPGMRKRALEYLVAAYGPEKLNDPGMAEPIVQQMIQMDPENASNYLVFAKILEDAGRIDEAEEILLRATAVAPRSVPVYTATAGFYNRVGDFPKTMEALHKAADLEPDNPDAHQRVAVFYWEKAFRDQRLSSERKREYVLAATAATDRALAVRPEHIDALTYKNILLRMQANEEPDQNEKDRLIAEADALRDRAIELSKQRGAPRRDAAGRRRGVCPSASTPAPRPCGLWNPAAGEDQGCSAALSRAGARGEGPGCRARRGEYRCERTRRRCTRPAIHSAARSGGPRRGAPVGVRADSRQRRARADRGNRDGELQRAVSPGISIPTRRSTRG
jgi:tetratricopeptide (TPR) repeat protein